MNLRALADPSVYVSLAAAVLVFGLDRAHKTMQVSANCISLFAAACIDHYEAFIPFSMTGWSGGEVVRVTPFFDYVLVWNTGISYGLLDGLPVWTLGLIMFVAVVALAIWWVRADSALLRLGLALCIGGALSNGVDRLIYGAVADFFHFHWGTLSFYIFNLADVAITFGVVLLLLDMLGVGRPRPAPTA
ncbi:MAG: lspA [Devosia sp.]|jgi:signal peptidase II|nr:lspA [Devosia sp.]